MKRISAPIESLIQGLDSGDTVLETDYLIIGSGYGGAVAAMRLAGAGARGEPKREVVVLERGREYGLGDFPYDVEDIPSHVRMARSGQASSGYSDALFHLYPGTAVESAGNDQRNGRSVADVLVGSGLGGTSLINANVAEEPLPHVFKKPAWPREFRDAAANPLQDEFDQVRARIGVTTRIGNASGEFRKYTALSNLGDKLGKKAEIRPANIAVTTPSGGGNNMGVRQAPCTDCGNCVTGCNVGAKNTLDRNLLRLAKARGARLFTGATVVRIEPNTGNGRRWRVIVQLTVQPVGTEQVESYVVLADNVILAAGSLGSTEILLRSQAPETLQLSPRLGDNFSTNGDGLIMSYAQTKPVRAIAESAQVSPQKRIGPTITGIVRTERLTFEDASVPAALGRVFSELVTTSAMLQRLADGKMPPLIEKHGYDPLAASMAVADHCQALLVMGDDGARGKLSLTHGRGALQITFPESSIAENDALVRANARVSEQDRKSGLDGGQYAPNPLWQLMPKAAEEVLGEGALPAGRVITVHPLGGCAMADTVAEGVVDHAGRVFRGDGAGLYEGLYVMDGAIVPAALEVNPFLTIAALAWRNTGRILNGSPESSITTVVGDDAELGDPPQRHRYRPQPTAFVIREQLTGRLDALSPWFKQHLSDADQQRLLQRDGLVVQVCTEPTAGEAWLEDPGGTPLKATMQLYVNPLSTEQVALFNPVGVAPAHLAHQRPFLELDGEFTVLSEHEPPWYKRAWWAQGALRAFVARRGLGALSKPGTSPFESIAQAIQRLPILWNLALMQTRVRHLSYAFFNRQEDVTVSGRKVLGYHDDFPRLWPALLDLSLTIGQRNQPAAHAVVRANTDYLVEPGLVEVRGSANLPQSLQFTGGLAAFFARSVFATQFWELAGLEYAPQRPNRPQPPALLFTGQNNVGVAREKFTLPVAVRDNDPAKTVELLLWRYAQNGKPRILLLHGLAQGSQIFWQRGKDSLAALFYDAGYEVWLLDYRLSNLILPDLPDKNWTMDEIARLDIPAAIDRVYSHDGRNQPVHVFAHCVGACTLAMAALTQPGLSAKIAGAICNAIHPWVIASPGNRFRAKFGNFLREWIPEELLDPVPTAEAGALQRMMDRLAYSLARIGESEDKDHRDMEGNALAQSVCDRMTFLYGRMWNHQQLADSTHEAFVEMLGPAPLGVYQQMYYFTQLRRLVDRHGENTYLTGRNIGQNWTFPILFIHGEDSRVFNPHSARRSAHRLHDVLAASNPAVVPAVRCAVYPGCGHMDVIFGKAVAENCFADYQAFFRDPNSFTSKGGGEDWPEPFEARPKTGPILRAASVSADNLQLQLRLWAELRTHTVDPPAGLLVTGAVTQRDFEIVSPGLNPPPQVARYRMADLQIANFRSPISLQVRADSAGTKNLPPAELHFDDHAWLQRLRARNPVQPPRMRFLVGSCRYPGSIVDNTLSDSIFGAMREHIYSTAGDQLLFLIGDQIYADAVDQLYEMKSLQAKYDERYRRAFGPESPLFARLVAEIPTHFAVDDHEIDDNWSGRVPGASPDDIAQEVHALQTASRYLGAGRDQFPVAHGGSGGRFHYALSHPHECDFPAFIVDTRTERDHRATNEPCRYDLMSPGQYGSLLRWLDAAHANDYNSPKFIFSGSVIAPLSRRYCQQPSLWRQQDGWAGYPKTLESLLAHIAEHDIRKVVFVGGDAHLSSISKLTLRRGARRATVVWQIVSSGLYAPMPFANSHVEDYAWHVSHPLPIHCDGQLTLDCENFPLSDHYYQFVRVDAGEDELRVTCHDENNAVRSTRTFVL